MTSLELAKEIVIKSIPSVDKLRALADWFDKQDFEKNNPNHEVQDDLRALAGNLEGLNTLLTDADDRLKCYVKDDKLIISIGVNTLAFCAENNNIPDFNIQVIDNNRFAEDVCGAIMDEFEDGSSDISNLLDKAIINCAENGSEWCKWLDDPRK